MQKTSEKRFPFSSPWYWSCWHSLDNDFLRFHLKSRGFLARMLFQI